METFMSSLLGYFNLLCNYQRADEVTLHERDVLLMDEFANSFSKVCYLLHASNAFISVYC